jgi:hypothetical protein
MLTHQWRTRVGGPATVPDLHEEQAPLVVHGFHDGLPGLDLLRGVDARRVGPPAGTGADCTGSGGPPVQLE